MILRQTIDVNARYLSLMSLGREEIIGKPLLQTPMAENGIWKFIDLLDEHGSVKNHGTNINTRHNVQSTVIISAEKIEINGDDCFLVAITDITEMKQMQAEMTRLDQLNLIGQMAAGIGHEIRNPISTVRGYLQLLGTKPQNAAQKPTYDLMISELDRANSILTAFLSLARAKPTEFILQNLNDILSNLYPLLESDTFTQNKQIRFIPGEIPELYLNSKEISQLILNLTRNGLEAMPYRGCLTIQTHMDGNDVVLSVQDEGPGIPPEIMCKLGTPFFTTKDQGKGLGLAICYRIANSHHARINVDSSIHGTTFHVRFTLQE